MAWRRQAAAQRRTASALQPLEQRGDLVLHDVTLPGWPAGLEHLVIGSTGVWVIQAWHHSQPSQKHTATSRWQARGATADPLPKLRWQAAVLPTCWPMGCCPCSRCCASPAAGWQAGSVEGVTVATTQQLVKIIEHGAPLPAGAVDRATTRALELLRPAV